MHLTFDPIGIALAIIFVGSLLVVYRWMFSAGSLDQASIRASNARRAGGHCIIVPVLESVASMQAAELACQIGSERRAKIILAGVVEIPMTLGLGEPVPGAVDQANRLLRQAQLIVMQHRLPLETRVLRGRQAGDAIVELARECGAETIVVGARTATWWPTSQIGSTVSALAKHAPCQVVVAKAASQAA